MSKRMMTGMAAFIVLLWVVPMMMLSCADTKEPCLHIVHDYEDTTQVMYTGDSGKIQMMRFDSTSDSAIGCMIHYRPEVSIFYRKPR